MLPAGCRLISKIETSMALSNLSDIIELSDEILIDRGDLSREINIPMVPIATQRVIDICNSLGKPVNVATNILDSMMTQPIPSRAEISDIFNLLNDGVSGLVLAAEVAIGQNPVSSVSLLKYLIDTYHVDKQGLRGIASIEKPSPEFVGAELLSWL